MLVLLKLHTVGLEYGHIVLQAHTLVKKLVENLGLSPVAISRALKFSKPYLPVSYDCEGPFQAFGMERQETADCGDLPGSAVILQAQEYNPSVYLSVTEDLLAEVFIVRYQNPTLGNRSSDHGIVVNPTGSLIHGEDIVTLIQQPAGYRRSGTFIHEEAHL